MGKGKDPNQASRDHQSTPLSALRDPSEFAPPPKHSAYYGNGTSASPSTSSPTVRSPTSATSSTAYESRGLGAALPKNYLQQKQQKEQAAREEEEAPKPPSGPFRANTSGLSTSHLPKPPVRRVGTGEQGVSQPPAGGRPPTTGRPPPSLPPRLPPRQNSHPDAYAPEPPPSYHETVKQSPTAGSLNQRALDRLGQSGVSVPGFNIGRTASPPVPSRASNQSPPVPPRAANAASPTSAVSPVGHGNQMNELQSRFSRMASPSQSQEAGQGTTWAQKQAALKTATAFRNDPSSVSLSDARAAASTANNFRERHGQQVSAGLNAANGLNQKYGVLNRMGGVGSSSSGTEEASAAAVPAVAAKKGPPPPPPKKKELSGSSGAAPPIPLSSKPRS